MRLFSAGPERPGFVVYVNDKYNPRAGKRQMGAGAALSVVKGVVFRYNGGTEKR
jgi:hypothetical protein